MSTAFLYLPLTSAMELTISSYLAAQRLAEVWGLKAVVVIMHEEQGDLDAFNVWHFIQNAVPLATSVVPIWSIEDDESVLFFVPMTKHEITVSGRHLVWGQYWLLPKQDLYYDWRPTFDSLIFFYEIKLDGDTITLELYESYSVGLNNESLVHEIGKFNLNDSGSLSKMPYIWERRANLRGRKLVATYCDYSPLSFLTSGEDTIKRGRLFRDVSLRM